MISNALLNSNTASGGMRNQGLHEYAKMEYKGESDNYVSSMMRKTQSMEGPMMDKGSALSPFWQFSMARDTCANTCLYGFAIFAGAIFVLRVALLFD